jgi:tRNA1Val (adenine37-N6)-methyltransferase
MVNSYFEFRQFCVAQGNCGMKVSTDACIQGAWTPLPDKPCRILDIGTGTGLLSLMVAQRAPGAVVDAVEIDAAAAQQAKENIAASPFADRIAVYHTDARNWQPQSRYDVLICNPPFFNNSLTGPAAARNLARHGLMLQQADLIRIFERVLKPDGYASVLWPAAEGELFTKLAAQEGWTPRTQLSIKDTDDARIKRIIRIYARNVPAAQSAVLTIKESTGQYTSVFKDLLASFYLHL